MALIVDVGVNLNYKGRNNWVRFKAIWINKFKKMKKKENMNRYPIEEYPIEIYDNYIIAVIEEEKIFLDTGSNISISDGCELNILGKNYTFRRNFMYFSIDNINQCLGRQVNVLLGMDVLRNLNFFIDYRRKRIQFSQNSLNLLGTHISLEFFDSRPIVALQVNGENVRVFWDTGAKITYLNPNITNQYNFIGRTEDCHPAIGKFKTNIYEIPIILGNRKFTIRAGNLPEQIQQNLITIQSQSGTQGFLGNNIFEYFNICFNFCNEEIILVDNL